MAKKTPFLAQLPRPLPGHRWTLSCPPRGNAELPKGWERSEAEEHVCHGSISVSYYARGSGQWWEGYRVGETWPMPSRSSQPSMAIDVYESVVRGGL